MNELRIFTTITSSLRISSLVLVTLTGVGTGESQCSQQAPNQVYLSGYSVPPGTIIYYQFDSKSQTLIPPGIGANTPTSQITAAFNAWSASNNQPGGSGTTFALADANHPATVTISADQAASNAGATTIANTGLISMNNPATIIFHPNAVLTGTPTSAFQVSQPGYDSVYLQVALHEIAHLMGIDDYPPGTDPGPGPSTSVVTAVSGVNDQGNLYQKSGPTECDRQQALSSTSTFAASANSSNSGGGGGGRGGEGGGPVIQYYPPDSDPGHPCDWNEYWDASTQTLYAYCS